MSHHTIPKSLRYWFLAHFFIDILFAIPLLLFPAWLLEGVGFETTNLLLARMVGAALIGIGGVSLIMRNKDTSAYIPMLQLKLLWSGTVIIALVLSFSETKTTIQLVLLATFMAFFLIWLHYFRLLSKNKLTK